MFPVFDFDFYWILQIVPQLLDCFVIPVVLLLSWFFLLVRYKVLHFVGVGVCLLGMGCMVGADVLVGRQQGLGKSSSLHGGITAVSRHTLNINPHNNPLSFPLGGVLFHK